MKKEFERKVEETRRDTRERVLKVMEKRISKIQQEKTVHSPKHSTSVLSEQLRGSEKRA